jgi:hypothetical protein
MGDPYLDFETRDSTRSLTWTYMDVGYLEIDTFHQRRFDLWIQTDPLPIVRSKPRPGEGGTISIHPGQHGECGMATVTAAIGPATPGVIPF